MAMKNIGYAYSLWFGYPILYGFHKNKNLFKPVMIANTSFLFHKYAPFFGSN